VTIEVIISIDLLWVRYVLQCFEDTRSIISVIDVDNSDLAVRTVRLNDHRFCFFFTVSSKRHMTFHWDDLLESEERYIDVTLRLFLSGFWISRELIYIVCQVKDSFVSYCCIILTD
jgi:hypothetical protein